MYARYIKTREGTDAARYLFQEQVSLFGCNNGFIPWLLGLKLLKEQGEPWKWHIDIAAELGRHSDYQNSSLLIDLKPKQNKTNLSLYEVMDVWGYSENGWSPILLRLNGIFVDEDPSDVDRNTFVRKDADIDGPIYEFLYLVGSVSRGQTHWLVVATARESNECRSSLAEHAQLLFPVYSIKYAGYTSDVR